MYTHQRWTGQSILPGHHVDITLIRHLQLVQVLRLIALILPTAGLGTQSS